MKKKTYLWIAFPFLLVLFKNNVLASYTTIYSPEGRWVYPVSIRDEASAGQIAGWNDYTDNWIDYYELNAVRIGNSSRTYNCHGYAWVKSENMGTHWVNWPERDDYIDDQFWSNDILPSYLGESHGVTESQATHSFYDEYQTNPDIDHSVRKIQNSYPVPISGGRDYISKWAEFGLVQHAKHHDIYAQKTDPGDNFRILKTTHYGTLTNHPKTWIGAGGQTHTITGNITIPLGVTLTIKPGATVAGNNHQISVYGTLKIVGTADARVTITETYIRAYSGATVEIDYADISDSYSYGLYMYGCIGKINNSTFTNNSSGGIIFLSPQSGSEIKNCTFTGNSNFGLYLGNANIPNDKIADNWFEDNYDGIRFYSGGNANLTTTRPDPWDHQGNPGEAYLNNIIKDNDRYGIYVSSTSTPMLGSLTWIGEFGGEYYYYGGFNAFVNAGATKYIYSSSSNSIDIRLNFWDVDAEDVSDYVTGNFTESEGSNLYINPGSLSKPVSGSIAGISLDREYQPSPLRARLLVGDSLLLTEHFDEAFEVYNKIINDSPDANEARVALNRIIYIYWNQEKQAELIYWLNGIHAKFPGKLIGAIAYDYTTPLFIMKGDVDKAISRNDEVVSSYDRLNEPEYAAEALYENMLIYENMAMESDGLSKISASEAITKVNEYQNRILNDYAETGTAELLREMGGVSEPVTMDIPTEFALKASYPNPFNPLTNIVFEIPSESKVSLVIYDLAGRTVWEMPNSGRMMSPGQYTVQWDGRNRDNVPVATGIYLIRLMTPQFSQTRKVVFMK